MWGNRVREIHKLAPGYSVHKSQRRDSNSNPLILWYACCFCSDRPIPQWEAKSPGGFGFIILSLQSQSFNSKEGASGWNRGYPVNGPLWPKMLKIYKKEGLCCRLAHLIIWDLPMEFGKFKAYWDIPSSESQSWIFLHGSVFWPKFLEYSRPL